MAHLIPIPFLAITVTLLVRARFHDSQRGEFIFKPISSLLFILVALLSLLSPNANPWYTALITLGLLLSMGGDLALMFRSSKAFLIGLILFLLAHVVYALVWTAMNGIHAQDLYSAAVMALVGLLAFLYLRPGLGSMLGPVVVYVLAICFMVNRAISSFYGDVFTQTQAWLVTAGAVLFAISDLMLAANRFRKPFKSQATSLFFYYGGQILIALSASYFG